MAERAVADVVLMDWRSASRRPQRAAQLYCLQGDLPPPMVIMITAYGREVLADARDHSAPPFVDFLTKPGHAQTGRLGAACVARRTGRPGQPAAAPGGAHQRLRGVRLLVVEDNALNRQVAAELLSSEGAQVALADGGLAGVQRVLEASVPFDAVLMDMQMPDIDGLEATRRIRADGRFAGLPILAAMTANASLADREACGGGHERPCGEADRQGAPGAFACSVISAGAAPGARRQRRRTRANWSRRGAISSGVSAAAWS